MTNPIIYLITPLVIGFMLDLLLGDPRWLPHPIRLFGNLISFGEKRLNIGKNRLMKGLLMTVALICITWVILHFSSELLMMHPWLYLAFTSTFVFYGLANHSLITESIKVEQKLTADGLEAGRLQLSYIVGRDTSALSENQIRLATLETLSENLSDGVVAPLFYYAIGGVPMMLVYKMVNTLDSMIGYKNERYMAFGWFAARTDDVANFIPARITALLMIITTMSNRGLVFIFKYGHKHSSPNSGYPESALAGILNCRFGGSNIYHGKTVEKPFIGKNNRTITHRCIYKACAINICVSLLVVLLIVIHSLYRAC